MNEMIKRAERVREYREHHQTSLRAASRAIDREDAKNRMDMIERDIHGIVGHSSVLYGEILVPIYTQNVLLDILNEMRTIRNLIDPEG